MKKMYVYMSGSGMARPKFINCIRIFIFCVQYRVHFRRFDIPVNCILFFFNLSQSKSLTLQIHIIKELHFLENVLEIKYLLYNLMMKFNDVRIRLCVLI